MTNRTLYMSIVAFAAAAATVNANTNAHAQMPTGNATLSQLIQEDLDADREAFTLALVERTGAKFNARMAKLDNVFSPLIASHEAPEVIVKTAHTDMAADLTSLTLASAQFEIAKDTANIENPFNPHQPMPAPIIAFASDEQ